MKRLLFAWIVILLFFAACTFALPSIQLLPSFSFESYDGTTMEQEALSNLGIRLIIYGSPDALTTNRTQLDLILEHLKTMNRTDQLLYTINFSSYPRFIRSIIKGQMKSNSEEVGIRIYADWDGVLSSHFNLDNSQVSFFLIEDIGVIQERFYFNDALTALDILAKIVR